MLHLILVIKRACLNYGVEKQFKPEQKKKDILERAQDKADGNEDDQDQKKKDSDEYDGYTDEQRNQLVDAKRKINEYRFKNSYLVQMAWGDLEFQDGTKVFFYFGQCLKRIAYAFALVHYREDACLAA